MGFGDGKGEAGGRGEERIRGLLGFGGGGVGRAFSFSLEKGVEMMDRWPIIADPVRQTTEWAARQGVFLGERGAERNVVP